MFETNIRFVGGLLSCYALTGDEMFKDKAKYVADQLLPAFDTVSGIPKTLIDFEHKSASYRTWKDDMSTLSELGSLHLEFYYLSDITGDPIYRKMVEKIRTTIDELYKPRGLYPDSYVHAVDNFGERESCILHFFKFIINIFKTTQDDFSIGTSSDSFFEYILKGWIQSGKTKDADRKMFDEAMEAIIEHLVVESSSGLTYIASESKGNLSSGMDHFSCFAGGLFALGAHTKRNYMREKYRDLSEEVTKTCHESYIRSHTHLGPDYFRFEAHQNFNLIKLLINKSHKV